MMAVCIALAMHIACMQTSIVLAGGQNKMSLVLAVNAQFGVPENALGGVTGFKITSRGPTKF